MALTGRTNSRDYLSRCEDLLGTMNEVYSTLIIIDYPDALTRSLGRNTDMLRSVPERTHLTLALRQRRLEDRLSQFPTPSRPLRPPSAGPFAS